MIVFRFSSFQIADKSCLLWESSCGKKGNCWFYDQRKFRNYFHWTTFGFMALVAFSDLFVIKYAHIMQPLYEEDEEIEEKKAKKDAERKKRRDEEEGL